MNNDQKSFPLRVWSGLFYPKHFKKMGPSIWLFGVLIDMITTEDKRGFGMVWGGAPITYETIRERLPITERQYRRYLKRLVEGEYILTKRTRRGLCITVVKSKKFVSINDRTKMSGHTTKNVRSQKPDRTKMSGHGNLIGQKCPPDRTKMSDLYIDIEKDIKKKEDIKREDAPPCEYLEIWKKVHGVFNLPMAAYNGYSGDIRTTIKRLGYDNAVKCVDLFVKRKADHAKMTMDKLFHWKKIDEYMAMLPRPVEYMYFVCLRCGDAKRIPANIYEESDGIKTKVNTCKCGEMRVNMTREIESWNEEGLSPKDIRANIDLIIKQNNDPEFIRKQISESFAN